MEHAVNGDPQRGLRQTGTFVVEGDTNPNVEHANRGKRSIGIDMSTPEGARCCTRSPNRRRVPDQLPARTAYQVRYRRR